MRLGRKALVTGTQVNYYYVCRTKLWLFSHGVRMEPESDLVMEGRLLHERDFPGRRKEVAIDGRISVDFLETREGLVLHEVKRSRSFGRAAEMQLLYYLYYLRGKGVDVRRGSCTSCRRGRWRRWSSRRRPSARLRTRCAG